MKKLFLIIVTVLLLLSGCKYEWTPRIAYQPTGFTFDNVRIDIEENHVLNKGHSYDVVETENGYDLVLHFVEVEDG